MEPPRGRRKGLWSSSYNSSGVVSGVGSESSLSASRDDLARACSSSSAVKGCEFWRAQSELVLGCDDWRTELEWKFSIDCLWRRSRGSSVGLRERPTMAD